MTPSSRTEAQQCADEIRVFRDELVRLQGEGVLRLDAVQRAAVTNHHDALLAGLIAFISARTGTWSGMYWIRFGERPENAFSAAVAMFLVPRAFDHGRFVGTAALIWHGTRNRWSEVVNTGVTLFVIFLYTMLFDW